ncbi:flagellar basal body rod protein FlgB [Thiospirochaeta perfilievii]|uniref:Flagellar basal body rod protein FlgB n=1 Tax=Thiospirochaeta perfilievii TaxID=252967 RepID=A0A5C1Q8I1_9SPIO|nr:flagellar basal body rod protein FlgB [Thiospirochaeta perfilievii]QEN03737.1 flagellar basal body rod protein FlgB [Thiospirochaeta perfilievii]
MFDNTTFGKSLDVLQRTMDVSLLRREVISNNIANAETPNFKRTDVTFEESLSKALASEGKNTFKMTMTDERHIPADRTVDYKTIKPRRVLDYTTQSDSNGNNVDIEVEMMDVVKNQMRYQLLTQAVSEQFQKINMVVK